MNPALRPLDDELKLVDSIGEGTSAEVWRAVQVGTQRVVAVKLRRRAEPGATDVDFQREARLMARVAHPGIVPVLRHGALRGLPALVLQHVDGTDLGEVIDTLRQRGGAPNARALAQVLDVPDAPWVRDEAWWRTAAGIVRDIARALDHAHNSGVLHRDIKPANVLVDRSGLVQLTDFGIASLSGDAVADEAGSLAYLAPERLAGAAPTVRSDVYSLGVFLREIITLEPPLRASSVAGAVHEIDQQRRRVRSRSMPRDLSAVVEQAMAPAPEQRYATSADLARDLEAALAGMPVMARPESSLRRWTRALRRHRVAALGIAGSLLVMAAALTAVAWQAERSAAGIRRAAELSDEALEIALGGLDEVIIDTSFEQSNGRPLFDRKRAEALRIGVELGDALLREGAHPDRMVQRIEAVRAHAWIGLASVERRLGNLELAHARLADARSAMANAAPADRLRLAGLAAHQEMTLAASKGDVHDIQRTARAASELICLEESVHPSLLRLRPSIWSSLSESARRLGDADAAIQFTRRSEAAARALMESEVSGVRESGRHELARTLASRAGAFLSMERHDDAIEVLDQAFAVLEQLELFPPTPTLESELWGQLARARRGRGELQAALEADSRALTIQLGELAAAPDYTDARYRVAETRYHIAQTLLGAGRGNEFAHAQGMDQLKAAVEDVNALTEQGEASIGAFQLKMLIYRRYAGETKQSGDRALAALLYRTAAEAQNVVCGRDPGEPKNWGERRRLLQWAMAEYLKSSTPEEGIQELRRCCADFLGDPLVPYDAACMASVLGRKQLGRGGEGAEGARRMYEYSLEFLSLAIDRGVADRAAILGSETLAPVRELPGFGAVLRRLR